MSRPGSANKDAKVYYNYDSNTVLWRNTEARGETSGKVYNPIGLEFSWKGDLFVCEAGGQCVRVFDQAGQALTSLGTTLGVAPKDVAISLNDEVFVVNTREGEMDVVVLSTEGHRLDRWVRGVTQKSQGSLRGHRGTDNRLVKKVTQRSLGYR